MYRQRHKLARSKCNRIFLRQQFSLLEAPHYNNDPKWLRPCLEATYTSMQTGELLTFLASLLVLMTKVELLFLGGWRTE